ncbi:MAG: hypothetical protein IJP54_09745 [Synergistaceae bacterium]|nr:hypothetical protein [Synergistaceae bacterium]
MQIAEILRLCGHNTTLSARGVCQRNLFAIRIQVYFTAAASAIGGEPTTPETSCGFADPRISRHKLRRICRQYQSAKSLHLRSQFRASLNERERSHGRRNRQHSGGKGRHPQNQ